MEMTIIQIMSAQEAETCLDQIRAHFDSATNLAQEFEVRQGWAALGYADLRSCLIDRFDRHGYRLFRLSEVKGNIKSLSPMGQTPDDLKERHVRESGILDLPPEQQLEAYQTAKQLAAAENVPLQTNHVTKGVAQVKTKETVFQSNYVVVTHMVVAGDITPDVGRQFVAALDKLKPKARGHIVQLMAKFGLTCPALIEPIANMFDRAPGEESYVLPEVLSGFLAGTQLKSATLTDLRKANESARLRHIADGLELQRILKPCVTPEIITVYKGDPLRTLAALRYVLGDEVYSLRDLLMAE